VFYDYVRSNVKNIESTGNQQDNDVNKTLWRGQTVWSPWSSSTTPSLVRGRVAPPTLPRQKIAYYISKVGLQFSLSSTYRSLHFYFQISSTLLGWLVGAICPSRSRRLYFASLVSAVVASHKRRPDRIDEVCDCASIGRNI